MRTRPSTRIFASKISIKLAKQNDNISHETKYEKWNCDLENVNCGSTHVRSPPICPASSKKKTENLIWFNFPIRIRDEINIFKFHLKFVTTEMQRQACQMQLICDSECHLSRLLIFLGVCVRQQNCTCNYNWIRFSRVLRSQNVNYGINPGMAGADGRNWRMLLTLMNLVTWIETAECRGRKASSMSQWERIVRGVHFWSSTSCVRSSLIRAQLRICNANTRQKENRNPAVPCEVIVKRGIHSTLLTGSINITIGHIFFGFVP